jgi:hypothetical protein
MSQTPEQTQEQKEKRQVTFRTEHLLALSELLERLISYQEMARGITVSISNDHLSIAHATADSHAQIDVLPDDVLQITADRYVIIADLRVGEFYIEEYEDNLVKQIIRAKYIRTKHGHYSVTELISTVKRALSRLQLLISRFAQNWYEVD